MTWPWRVVTMWAVVNVVVVGAALVRSVIRDRKEKGASDSEEARYPSWSYPAVSEGRSLRAAGRKR